MNSRAKGCRGERKFIRTCSRCGKGKGKSKRSLCAFCAQQGTFGPEDVSNETIVCRKCLQRKPRSEFDRCRHRASQVVGRCKSCLKEGRMQREASLTPEGALQLKLVKRDTRLRRVFRITLSEYDAVLRAQGGACAGCKRPATELKHTLHVDHDHSTHLVRGLLCWHCNQLLPSRRGLRDILASLVEYLSSPPAVKVIGKRFTTLKAEKLNGNWGKKKLACLVEGGNNDG